ncbi:hypothetical protein CURTO8I2_280153 [Curtobacterium sp. 8I-2]|nr:hypothetical protein CURTO8I2_280153 [Curtobacterium sp. 8I-2]
MAGPRGPARADPARPGRPRVRLPEAARRVRRASAGRRDRDGDLAARGAEPGAPRTGVGDPGMGGAARIVAPDRRTVAGRPRPPVASCEREARSRPRARKEPTTP